jgi:hypothetical protein
VVDSEIKDVNFLIDVHDFVGNLDIANIASSDVRVIKLSEAARYRTMSVTSHDSPFCHR